MNNVNNNCVNKPCFGRVKRRKMESIKKEMRRIEKEMKKNDIKSIARRNMCKQFLKKKEHELKMLEYERELKIVETKFEKL